MNRATRTALIKIQANPFHLRAALFHSTPVLDRRRGNHWDSFRRSANKGYSRRSNYYSRSFRKLNSKEALLHDVSAFAESLFQGMNYDYDEYETSSSRGSSWFRPDYRSRGPKGGRTKHRGPWDGVRRGFEFCEDDDDVETLFRSAFGGNRYFWSFMNDEPPRSSSGYYNNYNTSWNWSHGQDYETDSDNSESDLTVEREALGLSGSGPIKLDDVKNAYRKCALKWHPDRHQGSSKAVAEEKFKVCSAAYQLLCDKMAVA